MDCLAVPLSTVGLLLFALNSYEASPSQNQGDDFGVGAQKHTLAMVNLTYIDPATGLLSTEQSEMGQYGSESRTEPEWGWVVHVRTSDNRSHGCSRPVNAPSERWIALVERGMCRFQDKIHNTAVLLNASAVVVYNYVASDDLLTMKHSVSDVVSIFIGRRDGERLVALVDNGTRVLMHIFFSRTLYNPANSVNRTSVMFVTISFILLMVISGAWLIFYYMQRFRYVHTKDRLSKELTKAAKKAMSRMEQRTLRRGDKETNPDFDLCAICVESYRISETIRVLPCQHVFHKTCIDPWLIERRNCPICKLDILQACGIHVNCPRENQGSHISTNTEFEVPYFLTEASEHLLHSNARYSNEPQQPEPESERQEATHSLITPTT